MNKDKLRQGLLFLSLVFFVAIILTGCSQNNPQKTGGDMPSSEKQNAPKEIDEDAGGPPPMDGPAPDGAGGPNGEQIQP